MFEYTWTTVPPLHVTNQPENLSESPLDNLRRQISMAANAS